MKGGFKWNGVQGSNVEDGYLEAKVSRLALPAGDGVGPALAEGRHDRCRLAAAKWRALWDGRRRR